MYLVLNIYLSRMVKTPKVSPFSNWGVRARRVPPVRSAQALHPGRVPEQGKVCQVLGHSFRVRPLSDTNPGVFAMLKPLGYLAVTPSASFSE